MMKSQHALHKKIVEFLISIPNVHDSNTQRALIYSAGLDTQLQNQINFVGPPAQFFPLLVSILRSYGKLEDGRNALEAVLESAKSYVGQDRRDYCDTLIQELRVVSNLKGGIKKGNADNPFGKMGRIEEPDLFFDRKELLRQTFEELNKGGNISLFGESQIGKSSLLSMICKLGSERMKLPPENFVSISMEWVEDEEDFYETLCEELQIETCRGGKLRRALRGKRYILCLDEFEGMKWKGFTVKVRSYLRGLADGSTAPLRLVIASRSPLHHLFPDSPELMSPLAGICHQLDVNPFPPDVARDFLQQRLHGTGITFTEQQIHDVITKTGGHPAKLQDEAAKLFRELTR
jgi:hypothetical protein